ncbi:hypothetical protein LguiB_001696 [Lonicera macranthoides]
MKPWLRGPNNRISSNTLYEYRVIPDKYKSDDEPSPSSDSNRLFFEFTSRINRPVYAGIDPDLDAQVEFGAFQKLGDPSARRQVVWMCGVEEWMENGVKGQNIRSKLVIMRELDQSRNHLD